MNGEKRLLLTKFGYEELPILQDKNGIWYRENSSDEISIKECLRNYKGIDFNGKVVMDLGANIGGFSNLALKGGAKFVYAVEPDINNFEMVKKNTENWNNCEIINAAITDIDNLDVVDFYIGSGKAGPLMASLEPVKGRKKVSVNNLYAKDYIERVKPEFMKIDIEGGEYDILKYIPDSCSEVFIEWHVGPPRPKMLDLFNKNYPLFMSGGWKIVKEKKKESFSDPKYYGSYEKFIKRTGGIPNFLLEGYYKR